MELPFQEGPVPEEFLEAVEDLGVFCEGVGIDLPSGALPRLARYSQRLTEANSVMNLTRVTGPEDIASRHLADSLVFTACLAGRDRARVLDLGTGPGLPSLPLAVARPGWEVHALDSRQKKIAFVEAVRRELELPNLHPRAARAEELAHDREFRASFDAVVSRAMARLPVLVELAVPFLKRGGFLFAAKGSQADREVEEAEGALRELGAAVVSRETYPTLDPETEFVMLVIEKLAETKPVYPRHPSRIKSHPLAPVEV